MATQEHKIIFKKCISLIEDYKVRNFLAKSINKDDANISELIYKCRRMNLLDLILPKPTIH